MGTGTDIIHISLCLLGACTVQTDVGLGIVQVSLGSAEQEEVAVHLVGAVGRLAIASAVVPLHCCQTLLEQSVVSNAYRMVHTPEQGTVVTCDSTDFLGGLALPCLGVVGELLHQLTAYTHTGPVNAGGTCRKVANGLHGSAPVSGGEEQGATPTACNGTILQQGQDSLGCSTALAIVGHEEHVVCSVVAIHAFYRYV